MKFGDVILAGASLTIIYALLEFVMLAVMIPVNSYWGPDVSTLVSVSVASLIVGFVFAAKIHEESRLKTIGTIAVLFTVVLMLFTMALMVNPYLSVATKEGLESMYSTSGWTTWDWVAYSQLMIVMIVALNIALGLVFSFSGLYAGSMLRKPKKT